MTDVARVDRAWPRAGMVLYADLRRGPRVEREARALVYTGRDTL